MNPPNIVLFSVQIEGDGLWLPIGPSPCPVIAQVEWQWGELLPRIGFIVTNLNLSAKAVIRFFNQWGRPKS